jgi:hypothetical protein
VVRWKIKQCVGVFRDSAIMETQAVARKDKATRD